jgi:DNA ligase D-like protein (predicted 3'-phosphoesterase)
MDSLKDYRSKRDFNSTPEPSGAYKKGSKSPIFVIQKHSASSQHYDLRLEINGVLVSWAVPKGPSTDPKEKRLAMRTETHPLEYADFEGVIPKGHYGAGTVLVWDTGTYRNLTEIDGKNIPIAEALDKGHIAFWLEGQKLKGGYALVQTNKGKRWLLVKMKDKEADARRNPVSSQPKSVLSNRTLTEISKEE